MFKKKWNIIATIILIIQLALEIYTGIHLIRMNMLPTKYLVIILLLMGLVFVLSALILLIGTRKKKTAARSVARVLSVIFAAVIIAGSAYVGTVLSRLNHTMDNITGGSGDIQAVACVYVMKNSPAVKPKETEHFVFGTIEGMDEEVTKYAVSEYERMLGCEITVVTRPSIIENAQALYEGRIDAILVNSAYMFLLEESEEFSDFAEQTRVIQEIEVPAIAYAEAVTPEEAEEVARPRSICGIDPFIMYVSGTDAGQDKEVLTAGRSDTNILVVVNPDTKQVLLLNTPRDFFIDTPAGGMRDKLTHCGIYGVNCSIGALSMLYDVNIDHYSQVNFAGFRGMIDAVGGIDVDVKETFEANGHYTFEKGINHMDGDAALVFARSRKMHTDGDNERGRNQMRVIEAFLNKVTHSGTKILTRYGDILKSLEGMYATDMTQEQIGALVKLQLEEMPSWNIKQYAVRGEDAEDYTYSMPNTTCYVMEPDAETVYKAKTLIAAVLNGEEITDNMLVR